MIKPALTHSILRQRIQRFLYKHNNQGRKQVAEITNQLCVLGPVYLFGGAIRDIALHGIRHFASDLDFVIDTSTNQLASLMLRLAEKHVVVKNKFGGYRVKCDKWWLDIWTLHTTWAFAQKHVELIDAQSLLKTTITNWDAVLFELNHQKLITPTAYFEQLSNGILRLNLAYNPNKTGALVRIIRCMVAKPVYWLDLNLIQYLRVNLACISLTDLREYEQQHYTSWYLNALTESSLQAQLTQAVNEQNLIKNQLYQVNLELNLV